MTSAQRLWHPPVWWALYFSGHTLQLILIWGSMTVWNDWTSSALNLTFQFKISSNLFMYLKKMCFASPVNNYLKKLKWYFLIKMEQNYCEHTEKALKVITYTSSNFQHSNQMCKIHETDFDFTSTRLLINLLLFQFIAYSDLCSRAPFFCSLSSQLRPDIPSKQINITQARCCLCRHDLHSYAIPFLSAEHILL